MPNHIIKNPLFSGVFIFFSLAIIADLNVANAANVTMTADDVNGAITSFNGAGTWSNGTAPSAGNDYSTIGRLLRTPLDGNNYTFGGGSLTLSVPNSYANGSFIFKGTGFRTYTINNLTNNGGLLRSGSSSADTCGISGNMMVIAAPSTIQADQSPFVINSPLFGTADLTNAFPAFDSGYTISYGGTNSGFTGRLVIGNLGYVRFTSSAAAPGNPAVFNAGQITTRGFATLIDNASVQFTNGNGGITLGGNVTFNTVNAGTNMNVTEPITGNFALTKIGSGILTLGGSNGFGSIIVSNGTLVLSTSAGSSYTGNTTVSGGTLLVNNTTGSGTSSGTVTVQSGATLGGTGIISGATTVNAGGTLSPGAGGIGTLTFATSPTLGGTNLMELNRAVSPNADKIAVTTGALTKGGVLTVTNIGAALQDGDTFTLFSAASYTGTFSATNLPAVGTGTNWWTTNNFTILAFNIWPTAGAANYTRAKGLSLKITISDLLTNVTGAVTGKTITLASVGTSTNGATITTNGNYILYTPGTGANSNVNESFTYTVSDGRGGSATGVINLTVISAVSSSLNFSKVGNVATLSLFGIPNYIYVLQTATNLGGPWWPILTNTSAGDGSLNFTDPNATNGQQFYRTAQP